MKLVVGLGNPGKQYECTRHNVGFMAVDRLADSLGIADWKRDMEAEISSTIVGGQKLILVKPQTFMNLSGKSVGLLAKYYRVSPTDILVIYDDMDIVVGGLRIRMKGSAGGHNGMKSIIEAIGDSNFPRIRIGIGRPIGRQPVIDYVLGKPHGEEREAFLRGVSLAADSIERILTVGLDAAMNEYNLMYSKLVASLNK